MTSKKSLSVKTNQKNYLNHKNDRPKYNLFLFDEWKQKKSLKILNIIFVDQFSFFRLFEFQRNETFNSLSEFLSTTFLTK